MSKRDIAIRILLLFGTMILFSCNKFEESKWLNANNGHVSISELQRHGYKRVPVDVPLFEKNNTEQTVQYHFSDFNNGKLLSQIWEVKTAFNSRNEVENYLEKHNIYILERCQTDKRFVAQNLSNNLLYSGSITKSNYIRLVYDFPYYERETRE